CTRARSNPARPVPTVSLLRAFAPPLAFRPRSPVLIRYLKDLPQLSRVKENRNGRERNAAAARSAARNGVCSKKRALRFVGTQWRTDDELSYQWPAGRSVR